MSGRSDDLNESIEMKDPSRCLLIVCKSSQTCKRRCARPCISATSPSDLIHLSYSHRPAMHLVVRARNILLASSSNHRDPCGGTISLSFGAVSAGAVEEPSSDGT